MHTGYDNFWMHKISRPKPVLNLPKNNNYSCALLTDNYKHMQSGGCPSHLSSFIPPQNNAASSHEKDHYRNCHDRSMWPSSVYPLPFMPSYANNLHPQEPFSSHTNNFVYSSPNPQAQEKDHFRHLEMSDGNVNTLTMHNTNTSTLAGNGLTHAQSNKNTNTQIPRIRVKDVFSLNNKSVQGQLGFDGHFGISQQKEALGCAAHCNSALEPQTEAEYIKYENANLVGSSKSSLLEHSTAKQICLSNQEQFQSSCSIYQQNDGFSLGNFELDVGRQIEGSLSSDIFQSSTPASLLSQLLAQESILERRLQNCPGNAGGRGGEKVTPLRNLTELHNAGYSDSDYSPCGLNEGAPENRTNLRNVTTVHCDLQENLPKINQVNFKSRNSASDIMTKTAPSVTSKNPPLKEINNQQNCFLKVSIPYTDKSTFIRFNDSGDTEINSALSFFEQNDKNFAIDRNTRNVKDEQNEVVNSIPPPLGPSSFTSHQASPEAASIRDSFANEGGTITHENSAPPDSTSLTSSPRRRQEFDALRNKDGDIFQNSTGAPEIIQQKFGMKISRGDDNTANQEIPTNDFTAAPLTLKQESFHLEIETASLQPAQNPPGGKEFHPRIKTEENSENLAARDCELCLQPPAAATEALAKCHVEGCGSSPTSRGDSAPVTDSDDHVDKVITLKNSSSKRGDVQKSGEKQRGREVTLSRLNYKSNINRDKLDLLIQFLKKDQDSDGSSSRKERQTCGDSGSIASSDSYRSRRKLNKASIVRHKNNSREMISLMSLKGSNFTCKTPQITERSKNLEKTEDGKSGCSKDKIMAEESVDISKERMKWPEKECVAEPSNEDECLSKHQFQESSEKMGPKDKCAARDENAVISTVRAFQNSKTHFCVSCNLVSSIESFWINVVSGKVRCLNCFKRITLKAKARGNVLKSKSNDLHDSLVKPLGESKTKTEKVSESKDSAAVGDSNSWDEGGRKRHSKCEGSLRKLNGLQENVRQEVLEIFLSGKSKSNERKESTNCPCRAKRRSSSGEAVSPQKGKPSEEKVLKTEKSSCNGCPGEELIGRGLSENQGVKDTNAKRKRKNSSGEENFAKRERHSSLIKQGKASTPKEQYLKDGAKEETVIKSEKSQGGKSSRSEERSENRTKKDTKGGASSNTRRCSDDTGGESRCHKVSAVEERGQKDLKATHCTDEWRKPLPGEGCPARKDHAPEYASKRSSKHETSDKSNIHNIFRAGRDHGLPKTSKLSGRRDPIAPDASARRSTSNQNGAENEKRMESSEQPRKRKNSNEDFSPRKVHILQDFVKRDSVQTTHPSKSSEAKASKESDKSQGGNLWNARIWAEKSERSGASKEKCVPFGEHLRKEAKPPSEGERARLKDLWKEFVASQRAKPSDPAKGKATGFAEQPRRKSKDEQRGPQKAVGSRRASDEESAVPKARILEQISGEGKWESLAAENRGKKKSQEKEESRSSAKTPKDSSASSDVLATSAKDGQSRKPDAASKLFGEKQSYKTSTGAPHGN